jgi:hypothetical protein
VAAKCFISVLFFYACFSLLLFFFLQDVTSKSCNGSKVGEESSWSWRCWRGSTSSWWRCSCRQRFRCHFQCLCFALTEVYVLGGGPPPPGGGGGPPGGDGGGGGGGGADACAKCGESMEGQKFCPKCGTMRAGAHSTAVSASALSKAASKGKISILCFVGLRLFVFVCLHSFYVLIE